MKKEQVKSILVNQTKRRNTVFAYIFIIIIIFMLMILLFIMYNKKNSEQYVSYDEKSNIDYHVIYKENEFFDNNYLDSDKQYIASLIDSIKADFNFEIFLDAPDVQYKYSYRIESNVVIKDKSTKNLFYEKTEILLNEREKSTSLKNVTINERINIDYVDYNEKIKKMVKVYNLKNVESFLNLNMYVNVIGSCEEFDDNQKQEKIITLSIPLSENSFAIEFIDNTINSTDNVMICDIDSTRTGIFIIMMIALVLIEVCLIISVIRYEIKTRTAETIYEKEMKKILYNYGSSIQVLGSEFDYDGYQLLIIDTFSDLLEISDKLRQPILLKENNKKNSAYFIIPSNTKILYIYRLNVNDIEKKMNKRNKKN